MRFAVPALLLSTLFLTACSSNLPRVLNPGVGAQRFELSPSPVELTNDVPVSTFTVQSVDSDSPEFSGFLGQAAHYKAALNNAAMVLEVSP